MTRLRTYRRSGSPLAGLRAMTLGAASGLTLAAGGAAAQAPTPLPPLVIEGATLAVRPPVQPQPSAAATAPTATFGDGAGIGDGSTGSGGSDGGGAPVAAGQVGSAVTVVTGADLRSRQIRHAADALRSLPGVAVGRTGSFAGLTQVRLRGAEGNHTVVVIDGVEANSVNNGEFDFASLSTEDIERIEVIRGPQSGIYGANAIGGVVNIVTRGGRGPLTISTKAEAGSFNTKDGAVRISGGNDKAYFAGSLHKRTTSGFDIAPNGAENDGAEIANGALRFGAQIVKDVHVDLMLRSHRTRGGRDTEGAVLGELQEQVDSPTRFTNSDLLLGARLTWSMLGGGLVHELRTSRASNTVDDISPTFRSQNESETTKYAYAATARFATPGIPGIRHTLTGQIEQRNDSFVPLSDFADGVERDRAQRSFAGEWGVNLFGRLDLGAGARRDDNDSFADFTTWRATASLDLHELGLRPHASIGTAYKAPTMFELHGSIPAFFTPNPTLRPETSRGWDAGVELALWRRRVVLDVTYFNTDLENKINGFATDPVTFNFTAVNIEGRSRREGIETEAAVVLLPGLTLKGAYTYLDASNADGLREVRRPQHAARADLAWLFDGGRGVLNLGAVYNGEQDDSVRRVTGFFFGFPTLRQERFRLDDYTVVSLAAAYKLTPQLEAFGRVENLLDTRYQEVYGFETAGIAAYAGLRFTFEEPSTLHWRQAR